MNYWQSKEIAPFTAAHLLSESNVLSNYVQALNEQDLNKICTYSNMKGEEFQTSYFEVLLHVINHATYHRGQLITMLRNLGEENLPATDLIAFLRNRA